MTQPQQARSALDLHRASSDRLDRFETEIIAHALHMQALDAIARLHARWKPRGTPRRPKARALLIVGESGAGKSTALEDYVARHPGIGLCDVVDGAINGVPVPPALLERLRDADYKPVLLLELRKRMNERQLVGALYRALGYKDRKDWNTTNVIDQIVALANDLGVELILIDEGHNMLAKGPDGVSAIIEFLKSLLNKIGIPIVIAGLPQLLAVRDDITDRQMARRLEPSVLLVPYDWWTIEGRTLFVRLLMAFEKRLGLPEPSNLFEHEFAKRIYVATGGEVGWISKYLRLGLEKALRTGAPKLTPELFATVHAELEQKYAAPERSLDFDEVVNLDLEGGEPDPVAAMANPFLCNSADLLAMWQKRKAQLAGRSLDSGKPEGKERDSSRRTALKGRGRSAYAPFGKG